MVVVTLEVQGYPPLQGGVLKCLLHLPPGLWVVFLDGVAPVEVPKVRDQPDFLAVLFGPCKNWHPKAGLPFFLGREWSEGLGLAIFLKSGRDFWLHWTVPKMTPIGIWHSVEWRFCPFGNGLQKYLVFCDFLPLLQFAAEALPLARGCCRLVFSQCLGEEGGWVHQIWLPQVGCWWVSPNLGPFRAVFCPG